MEQAVVVSLVLRDSLSLEGLRRILADHGFNVLQCARSLTDIPADELGPNQVVIVEASLIDAEGFQQVGLLIEQIPGLRVVLLDDNCHPNLLREALAHRVCGYILKSVPPMVFITMVSLVALGEKVIPSEMISLLPSMTFDQLRTSDDFARRYDLSERERQILEHLVTGMPNKLISREMEISEATVKATVKGIFRKMSVTNRTQAAILARQGDAMTALPHDHHDIANSSHN
jgi:two-component system, NarL family, nitrate/nitrite response regulator NarL